jgi:hypothetical protein
MENGHTYARHADTAILDEGGANYDNNPCPFRLGVRTQKVIPDPHVVGSGASPPGEVVRASS